MTLQKPEATDRWIDLSAYGMTLKQVFLPSKQSFLLIRGGGDEYANLLQSMNFVSRGSGNWVNKETTINPRPYLRNFPKAKIVELPISSIVEHLEKTDPVKTPEIVKEMDREDTLVGINRNDLAVFEDENGVRFIKQNYGKRLEETTTTSFQPSHFLRCPEPQNLIGCAEGYLKGLAKFPDKPFAKLETFAAAIGVEDLVSLREAISAAVAKDIFKDKSLKLQDRYLKVLDYRTLLKDVDCAAVTDQAFVILARRLMGMDKDLIGQSVFCQGGPNDIFGKLIPERGVAIAEHSGNAAVLVDIAPSAKKAAEHMLNREPGSSTISIVPAATPAKAKQILEQLSKIVDIENAIFVGPEAGGPRLIVSSQIVAEPKQTFEMRRFDDPAELWTAISVTVTSRSHAIEAIKSGLSDTNDLTAAAAFISQNVHQMPYSSASKVSQPTLHVPKELKEATNSALDRLISTVGDVDKFVAREYPFLERDLPTLFSPEQIDALALHAINESRDRATLNADGAGAGKGRWNIAIAMRAIARGKKVILMSEGPTNLADLLRDAKHLGVLDKLNVAVLNSGVNLIDEQTGLPFETLSDEVMAKAVSDGVWPVGANIVVGTYSQVNKLGEHDRTKWLDAVVDENTALLGDEIHNAASVKSNTSQNMAAAIDKAGVVAMSSATHAHTTQMVAFYNRLLPAGMDRDGMRAMMVRGGENFQEVLTNMLVADGVMVRRELDVTDREFLQSVDFDNLDRNKRLMDQAAVIISELTALSGALDEKVEAHNAEEDNRRDGFEMKKMGIGAALHRMIRLFDAALMAKTVGEAAVQSLKDGAKPVVLVDTTIHALLDEGVRDHGGRAPDIKDVFTRILNQMGKVSISRVRRAAEAPVVGEVELAGGELLQLTQQNEVAEENLDDQFDLDDAEAGELEVIPDALERRDLVAETNEFDMDIARIHMLIEQFPDLPASAIDVVKNTLRDAGYSCGEITGRTLEVGQDGLIRPREDRDRMAVKNGFNSGAYDAIIINPAGTTGSDLHASERFADQRRRHFHVLQAPDKIQKEIQSYGRVSRRGQVVNALIHFHSSGLPFKVRLDSMRNNKLRFTSATVTGDRRTNLLMEGIPDLINPVGDVVVWNYAQKRPDLVEKLHLTRKFFPTEDTGGVNVVDQIVDQIADGKENETAYERDQREEKQMRIDAIRRNNHLANDFLARLSLLPVAYQEKVLRELGAEYELTIEEMNAKGENPLRPREISGVVHVVRKRLFEGSDTSTSDSAFDGPLHLLDVDIERVAEPISSDEVVTMIDNNATRYNAARNLIGAVMKNRDFYLRQYLPKDAASVEDAVMAGNPTINQMIKNMHDLYEVIEALSPGKQIDFVTPDGEKVKAVVARISAIEGFEHLASSYSLTVAIPGETQFITYSMTSVLKEQPIFELDANKRPVKVNAYPGLEGADYDKILMSFDEATARKRVPAKILSTNLYSAVRVAAQFGIGQLVTYVDVDGRRQRGVLINKTAEKRLEKASIRIEGLTQVRYALVDAKVEVNSSPYGTSKSVIISPAGDRSWYLRLPEPRRGPGGVIKWPSVAYRDLFEQTKPVDKKVERIHLTSQDDLDNALAVIFEAGFKNMYVSAKHRDKFKVFEDGAQPDMKMAGGVR